MSRHLTVLSLLFIACMITSVSATGKYYESKYHDYYQDSLNKITQDRATYTITGALICHQNIFSKEILITRDGANMTPAVITVLPDGHYEFVVSSGNYTLTLKDGNGGQPEVRHVRAEGPLGGFIHTIDGEFIGHAVTADVQAKRHVTITEATYGKIVLVTPAIPGVPESMNYVGHNHGDYDRVWFGPYDKIVSGNKYKFVGHNHGDYTYTAAIPGSPAIYSGSIVDVTSQVQAAVDGQHFNLKFDNAQNPGGLFTSGNVLLSQIIDPAPGVVKSVHIVADGRTIDAQEYEVINL